MTSARSTAGEMTRASARLAPARSATLFGMAKSLQPNILSLIEQLAQQTADPFEHPAWRPRILAPWLENFRFGEAGGDVALAGARGPPAGRDLRLGAGFPGARRRRLGSRGRRRRALHGVERQLEGRRRHEHQLGTP